MEIHHSHQLTRQRSRLSGRAQRGEGQCRRWRLRQRVCSGGPQTPRWTRYAWATRTLASTRRPPASSSSTRCLKASLLLESRLEVKIVSYRYTNCQSMVRSKGKGSQGTTLRRRTPSHPSQGMLPPIHLYSRSIGIAERAPGTAI